MTLTSNRAKGNIGKKNNLLCDWLRGKSTLPSRKTLPIQNKMEPGDNHGAEVCGCSDVQISTLRIGSPSDTVSAMAMAPSERTRQSPKLITWTLRKCFRACGGTHCHFNSVGSDGPIAETETFDI